MNKFKCKVCGYIYDPEAEENIKNSEIIPFEELPDEYECPICGVNKNNFEIFEE